MAVAGALPDARLATRIAALQAAATFAGGKALSTEVSTADVLKVAAAFEHWLLGRER